jgi:hypothetical protein
LIKSKNLKKNYYGSNFYWRLTTPQQSSIVAENPLIPQQRDFVWPGGLLSGISIPSHYFKIHIFKNINGNLLCTGEPIKQRNLTVQRKVISHQQLILDTVDIPTSG